MNKKILFSILLISVIGLTVYANSFNNPFIWDDLGLIVDNNYIKSFKYLPDIFSKHLYASIDYPSNFYRPFQSVSYLLDYSIFKLNPAGFHFTNTLLHILNALLVFGLVFFVGKNLFIAVTTALIFVVHPVHTEAVTYIAGRADLLLAFFALSCIFVFLLYLNKKRKELYFLSVGLFICAFLSKELAVILPFILLLCQFIFTKDNFKQKLKAISPFFAVAGLYIVLRLTVLNFATHSLFYFPFSLKVRVFSFFKAFVMYLRLLVFPAGLHMQYKIRPSFFINSPIVITSIVLFFGFLITSIRFFKKNKLFSFGLLWFFIWLIPQSNILPINASIAEHFLYLPSIGIFLAFSVVLSKIKDNKNMYFTYLIIASLVLSFSVVTIRQNKLWKDPEGFFKYTLKHSPDNSLIMRTLAAIYTKQGEFDKAEKLYLQALLENKKYNSDYFNTSIALTHANLASNYEVNGKTDLAIKHYTQAVDYLSSSHAMYLHLANVYVENKNTDKAIELLKQAIKKVKDQTVIYFEIAKIYELIKKVELAIDYYKKTLETDINFAPAYIRLGFLYDAKGDGGLAIDNYKKALKLNQNDPFLHNNLGIFFAKRGNFDQAQEFFNRAIELDSNSADFCYNLGAMYVENKDFSKAQRLLIKALKIEPGFIKAQNLLKQISNK